jgi:hypothetical protein
MTVYINGTTGYSGPVGVLGDLTTTGNTILGDASTDTLNVANGNLVLNSSGNLGLGVTPAAWLSSIKVMQVGTTGALWASGGITFLTNNTFTDGTDKYLTTAAATRYYQSAGSHIWNTAASGTAGNAVTFTQTMALDASGNLKVNPGNIYTDATSGIFFTGSVGSFTNGIFGVGTNNVAINAGGSERVRITSSGQLVLQSAASFECSYSGNGLVLSKTNVGAKNAITSVNDTSSSLLINNSASGWDNVITYTAGAEKMRITSGGDVAIGRTDPPMKLSVAAAGAVISGTATIGTNMQGIQVYNTTTATSDNAVGIWFPTGPHQAGIASFRSDAASTWNTVLAFYTHGEATNQLNDCFERMRITGEGDLLVGTTATGGKFTVHNPINGRFTINSSNTQSSGNDAYGITSFFPNFAPNNTSSFFYYASDNAAVRFQVRANGGIGNYQANDANLSDRREKTNFAPAKSYLDVICSIPVQTYNYIDQNLEEDGGLTLGVVAQDVQAVAPELVTESDWSIEQDGSKMRLSVYQTDLQYALMKAIQELKAELDSVKSELATIKGAA